LPFLKSRIFLHTGLDSKLVICPSAAGSRKSHNERRDDAAENSEAVIPGHREAMSPESITTIRDYGFPDVQLHI
jgi:hypothetical protein